MRNLRVGMRTAARAAAALEAAAPFHPKAGKLTRAQPLFREGARSQPGTTSGLRRAAPSARRLKDAVVVTVAAARAAVVKEVGRAVVAKVVGRWWRRWWVGGGYRWWV